MGKNKGKNQQKTQQPDQPKAQAQQQQGSQQRLDNFPSLGGETSQAKNKNKQQQKPQNLKPQPGSSHEQNKPQQVQSPPVQAQPAWHKPSPDVETQPQNSKNKPQPEKSQPQQSQGQPAWNKPAQPEAQKSLPQPGKQPNIQKNPVPQQAGPTPKDTKGQTQPENKGAVQKESSQPRASAPSSSADASSNKSAKISDLQHAEVSTPKLDSVTNKKLFRTQKVEANYLAVSLKGLPAVVIHYDIAIEPDRPKKMMRDVFKNFIATYYAAYRDCVAYDGVKNVYASKPILKLSDEKKKVTVTPRDGGRAKEFTVVMKEAARIDMNVIKNFPKNANGQSLMQAIQCLDVVLRTASDSGDLIRFKRSVFMPSRRSEQLPNNYQLWIGLFQSFILGSTPFLNVDVSHKAFPGPISLLDLYKKASAYEFTDYLKGLELEYASPFTGTRMRYKFNSLKGPADQEQFLNEEDQTRITVAQYFKKKAQPLKNPSYPVCHVGSLMRNILLPIEHLSVPAGQAINRRNPDSCTRDMIRFAATSTNIRKQKIMDLVKAMNYKNVETIKQFGISIGESFTTVNSHILNDRQIKYGKGRDGKDRFVKAFNGSWKAENEAYLIAPNLPEIKCGILNLSTNKVKQPHIDTLTKNIYKVASDHGIKVEPITAIEHVGGRPNEKIVEDNLNRFKGNVNLLFVIIPVMGDVYQMVKKKAELRCGILTQCLKDNTVLNKGHDLSTINNIMLKVNAKLTGTNHAVCNDEKVPYNVLRGPWMVIGADVTHPSPQETKIPSVVGVAASFDRNGFKYNCQWRLQDPRDEMIRDLEEIIVTQLHAFKAANNTLPRLMMYYRDGVSDGQFKEVSQVELHAIQRACKRMGMENTKIVFVVVQKRHHTRFFPITPNTMDKKNNNVIPGTVVDSDIVSPLQETFFMVSHQSLQGVAKPTKYVVIHDDAGIPAQELQAFTYGLCHMFSRCNRVVSYPAPTYYAHLVAYRGRVYIHNENIDLGNLDAEYRRRQIRTDMEASPMFFV